MTAIESLGEITKSVKDYIRLRTNRGSNAFIFGFSDMDEQGKEAYCRAINGNAIEGDPTLKELVIPTSRQLNPRQS